jgi:hypothetical protein
MKTLQASKSIPWQTERANRLQRACQTIKAAIQRGEKISRAIRRAARSRNGRKYKSDPSRRLALTASTGGQRVQGSRFSFRLHHGAANGLLMALKRMRGLIQTHCQTPI